MRKSNVQTLLDRISSMNGTADGNSYESIGTFRQFIGSLEQQPSSDARHNRVALLVSGELSQLGINIRRGNKHQAWEPTSGECVPKHGVDDSVGVACEL